MILSVFMILKDHLTWTKEEESEKKIMGSLVIFTQSTNKPMERKAVISEILGRLI